MSFEQVPKELISTIVPDLQILTVPHTASNLEQFSSQLRTIVQVESKIYTVMNGAKRQ